MNKTNEVHEEPREAIDDRERKGITDEEERGERLTTKDMAAGTAAKRAREEPHVTADSQNVEARDNQDSGRTGIKAPPASPLFESGETETFRARWNVIQTQFVDEPRRSVEQADELVASTMKRLAEIFASEREKLEREWDRGEDISTEDLRIALQRYRSFFDRLLSV
jgi:hypothetical protein